MSVLQTAQQGPHHPTKERREGGEGGKKGGEEERERRRGGREDGEARGRYSGLQDTSQLELST